MAYVQWLQKQTKRNGKKISDRYVHNIFSTLSTFALKHKIDTPNDEVLVNLGFAKKEVKAHTNGELELMWAAMEPDEELLYKFFLWSLGREKEVANTEVADLNFDQNVVHICAKKHRGFRLKSKRNKHGNVGDRFVPFSPTLMQKLKAYVERTKLKDGDLLFPNGQGTVEGHYLRKLQHIGKRAGLKFHLELHKLRKTGATLHYAGGKGIPLSEISGWLGHSSLQQTEQYLDVRATAASQEHIQHMVANGLMAAHA